MDHRFPDFARRATHMSIALLASGALLACGDGATSGTGSDESPGRAGARAAAEELRETGFGKYLGAQAPSRAVEDGEWTHYFFDPAEEGALCLVGGEFQVSVKDGPSDEVLFYLEGGGACWDYGTCHVANTATRTANAPVQSGIVDATRAENPFAEFDVVYVPYCDGSVFIGDATVTYGGVRTHHHGLQNLSVAVDALQRHFPDPERIVVAGSSAGGYGTYAGYGATRVAYPDTPILVFNDSGPGVQNVDASEDVRNRVANWNFTKLIPESCTQCSEQYSYLHTWATERDDSLRTALYSYQRDSVIGFFLGLSGADYQSLIVSVTDEIVAQNGGRFARYFPLGSDHTVLLSRAFYTQMVNGVSLLDWTQAFLDGSDDWGDIVEQDADGSRGRQKPAENTPPRAP